MLLFYGFIICLLGLGLLFVEQLSRGGPSIGALGKTAWVGFLLLSLENLHAARSPQASLPSQVNVEIEDGSEEDLLEDYIKACFLHAKNAWEAKELRLALSSLKIIERTSKRHAIAPSLLVPAFRTLALVYEEIQDFEWANKAVSQMLQYASRKEDQYWAWERKIAYGVHFGEGGRVRFLGLSGAPKLLRSYDLGLEILDEVASSASSRDLMRQATIEKGAIFTHLRQYQLARQQFAEITSSEASSKQGYEAFFGIARALVEEMRGHSRSEDLLLYAHVNRKRFAEYYPQADKTQLDAWISEMDEELALGYLEVARLYRQRSLREASLFYLRKIKEEYPHTRAMQQIQNSTWLKT